MNARIYNGQKCYFSWFCHTQHFIIKQFISFGGFSLQQQTHRGKAPEIVETPHVKQNLEHIYLIFLESEKNTRLTLAMCFTFLSSSPEVTFVILSFVGQNTSQLTSLWVGACCLNGDQFSGLQNLSEILCAQLNRVFAWSCWCALDGETLFLLGGIMSMCAIKPDFILMD